MCWKIQADGYQYNKFYNIDKTTGQVVTLKDLFPADADYVTALSGDIKDQMRARMKRTAASSSWTPRTPRWISRRLSRTSPSTKTNRASWFSPLTKPR